LKCEAPEPNELFVWVNSMVFMGKNQSLQHPRVVWMRAKGPDKRNE